jgi:hypothetical protein
LWRLQHRANHGFVAARLGYERRPEPIARLAHPRAAGRHVTVA